MKDVRYDWPTPSFIVSIYVKSEVWPLILSTLPSKRNRSTFVFKSAPSAGQHHLGTSQPTTHCMDSNVGSQSPPIIFKGWILFHDGWSSLWLVTSPPFLPPRTRRGGRGRVALVPVSTLQFHGWIPNVCGNKMQRWLVKIPCLYMFFGWNLRLWSFKSSRTANQGLLWQVLLLE